MAASVCWLSKWRTLKGCHHHILRAKNKLTCCSRYACTSRFLQAKSTDNYNQQAVAACDSPAVASTEESLSLNEMLEQEDYFGVKELVTLKDLYNARVHWGHNVGLRHPSMSPYIFGTRQSVDIIDLEQTLPLLHHALNVCAHIVYRGGLVLSLSRNLQILPWVEKMAKEVGEYSHCRPWKRGIFNDAQNVFGTLPIYPELCIFFNTQDTVFETHLAVTESSKLLIPSIGVVDTNCDNSLITYPIPANDDTPVTQHLFINLFKTVILRAKEKRREDGYETAVVA